MQRAAVAALAAAAFCLPFELTNPLLTLGPIRITSAELPLYAAIALGGAPARQGWSATAVHAAAAAWALAVLMSAALAPFNQALALKVALRSVSGCLLFGVAAGLVTSAPRAALIGGALAAGAIVSAAAGIAEVTIPGAASALMAFKLQPSRIGGFLRASGTFEYANTAAMYWEAVLPLLVALTARTGRSSTRWGLVALSLVVIEAIVLSLSRAALAVTTGALAVMVAAGFIIDRRIRRPALALMAGLALCVAAHTQSGGLLGLRLQTGDDSTWYRAEFFTDPPALSIEAGQTVEVFVTVKNVGRVMWPARGAGQVRLSYHWQGVSEREVVLDGLRSDLPANVPPGGEAQVRASVTAPEEPGQYILQWDLVQEHVMWFSMRGAPVGTLPVEIRPRRRPLAAPPPSPRRVELRPEQRPPRLTLWRIAWQAWRERPLAGIGPDNFRHQWGVRLGLTSFDRRITANSLYVETLVDLGLAGVCALLALMITTALYVGRRVRLVRRLDPATATLVVGLGVSVGTFYLHGLADYFLVATPTLGLFWLLTGMLVGLVRTPPRAAS